VRVLVTGGAGYIGSVTSAHLIERGHEVVVLDDLSTGHRPAVPAGARFAHGRVQDAEVLGHALAGADAVIHFASLSLVAESTEQPLRYFRENVGAALALLAGMERAGVRRLVFSSSAAVYGEPDVDVIDEESAIAPVNPYGHSKAMVERILAEQARAAGLAAVSLRYFNAAGADGPRGEDHTPETHLIPRLCCAMLGRLDGFVIHGDDYATPDATAIRDYVHVLDLASAHALALGPLDRPGYERINLGTGHGCSVREVIAAAAEVLGRSFTPRVGPRRAGDPPRLVASCERARARLGWAPQHDLLRILQDAYRWHCEHPSGFR
jgi:UDP-glucose 4-epimerase